MTDRRDVCSWPEFIRERYESYLKTSFFFRDRDLRRSFREALRDEGSLLKGPYSEVASGFRPGSVTAAELAEKYFPQQADELRAALMPHRLYSHQERAIRAVQEGGHNIVVATGTASGKTETFLYPILFELFREHLAGDLDEPGVRALILYPMNALANDQRRRLGGIIRQLRGAESAFHPTFGQYIGQTPEDDRDRWRNADWWQENRLPGERIFRKEMRKAPPHILLTNYSMLEYLLIRPSDSRLFDGGRAKQWQFLVLDEAHQYRGAKGMEMGMLVRRLKQRLREGGRREGFRCIATSATLASGATEADRQGVAEFARELFGEPFSQSGVIFGEVNEGTKDARPRRFHAFLRALEGAFLVHTDGEDRVVLNRKGASGDGGDAVPLEIALCKECGQHYYVGREDGGMLREAIRDPSHSDFGVMYFLPTEEGSTSLCRRCGALSPPALPCGCGAAIRVTLCESKKDRPDQLKECASCGYRRGGIGDPVQENVNGADGPNAVIATALHELLPKSRRRVLAFADSRQEAAFFAWYAQESYERVRDRNLMLRAIRSAPVGEQGLGIPDLQHRLADEWERAGLFKSSDTAETRKRKVLGPILREAVTDERRISLSGVGLVRWFVAIPDALAIPPSMLCPPWNLSEKTARRLISYLLDECRPRRAMNVPSKPSLNWAAVSPWPQKAYGRTPGGRHVLRWGEPRSAAVSHFLRRVLGDSTLDEDERRRASTDLMGQVWTATSPV